MLERRNIGLLDTWAVSLYLPLSVSSGQMLRVHAGDLPSEWRASSTHPSRLHEASKRGSGRSSRKFCMDSIMQRVAFVLGEIFRLGRYWVQGRPGKRMW
jgi:hypothetical protein